MRAERAEAELIHLRAEKKDEAVGFKNWERVVLENERLKARVRELEALR